MTDDVLVVEDLTLNRMGIPICRDICMRVAGGDVVTVLGPNGAGKSTLLEGLAAVIPATSGSIVLNGRHLDNLGRADRARAGLALVQQGRAIFSGMTVEENLHVVSKKADLHTTFEMFPRLQERAQSKAGLLSGGEQQMLVIARALMTKPRVLMIDELSLGLAPMVVRDLLTRVREVADQGVGVLLVEQFAELALDVADQAYVLQKGRFVFEGPSQDLRNDRSILEVAYLDVEDDSQKGRGDE